MIFVRVLTNLGPCLTFIDRKKLKYFFEIRYFSCFSGFSCLRFYDNTDPLTTLCKINSGIIAHKNIVIFVIFVRVLTNLG